MSFYPRVPEPKELFIAIGDTLRLTDVNEEMEKPLAARRYGGPLAHKWARCMAIEPPEGCPKALLFTSRLTLGLRTKTDVLGCPYGSSGAADNLCDYFRPPFAGLPVASPAAELALSRPFPLWSGALALSRPLSP